MKLDVDRASRWAKRRCSGFGWYLRWGREPYLNYYRRVVEDQAKIDPRATVGGLWNTLGPLQLTFLRSEGLQLQHELLDIGCGCLRGGLHFIRYLEPGHYWGMDLSEELLKAGKRFLEEANLQERAPHLLRSTGFTFTELNHKQFDFVLAFGVFPDVAPLYVRQCFAALGQVLSPQGRFYATFMPGEKISSNPRAVKFKYPMDFFQSLADEHGYTVKAINNFYHPRGHHMLRLERR